MASWKKMKRSDFYNDRRKERKINFLADYRIVRQYLQKKHGIAQAEFEMLCKMHSMGTFLKADFESTESVYPWSGHRWTEMLKAGLIVKYRDRKPSMGRNYNIYSIGKDAKNMVDECYKILCGEKAIPESKTFNPIMKEESYSDKKYAEAIRAFNRARNNK